MPPATSPSKSRFASCWRAALLPAIAVITSSCAPTPPARATRREPVVRWYRELPIERVGGDVAATMVDAERGVWIAVPGFADAGGRSRLFHRAPGGSWETLHDGPPATELSLSSVRAGEAYFGFNRILEGYKPTLLRVGRDGEHEMPAPEERIDAREYLQVGAYAMLTADDGWACGQRGSLWRLRDGAWKHEPPVLPWSPSDPANASYCTSLRFERPDLGWMVDLDGRGASFDGRRWNLATRDGTREVSLVSPANGLALDRGRVLRLGPDGWKELGGDALRTLDDPLAIRGHFGAVFDATGRWMAGQEGLVELEETTIHVAAGQLHFQPKTLAVTSEGMWALGPDGIYRGTRDNVPTFSPAPASIAPAGLLYPIAIDLDSDGDEDLVGLSPRGNEARGLATLAAYRADGGGRFSAWPLGVTSPIDTWAARFDLGDVDGDGDVDLVLLSVGNVELWRSEGGHFRKDWALSIHGNDVALADVDGDGDLDLSLAHDEEGLLWNDGAGVFSRRGPLPRTAPIVTERAIWADADGDGDLDAVLTHWRDPAHLLWNLGAGRFAIVALGVVAEGAVFDDLDRDGRPELLAQLLHDRRAPVPFVRCPLAPGAGCETRSEPPIPAGVLADLNLDGRKDVLAADLRGDESITSEGDVFLATDDGYRRVTEITGSLPQAVILDADGDGDPDVYSPKRGLFFNTGDRGAFVRVRPRASASDRLARGASVVARKDGVIVASSRAENGEVTLGLPDGAARYDIEVRFPRGERIVTAGVSAGADLVVRDAPPVRFHARLFGVWAIVTATLARAGRDVVFPLGLAVAAALALRKLRPRLASPARFVGLFAASSLALLGPAVREAGVAAWLAPFAALTSASILEAAAMLLARHRASRHAGPWLLVDKLGAGASATVWRARQGSSEVALKLFDADAMTVSESRERFFREARVGSEISHPNVVKIRDSGRLEDGRCYLAMQLVDGQSLASLLREEGRLAPARATAIACDLAGALTALHGAGILHRDVKPDNVVIRRDDGAAVLTDLGLARSVLFRTMTRTDVAVGTLSYMSPEQCVGRPLDGRTDIWSLGVTLYEMLVGTRPFVAEHELELVYVIHNVDPPPPRELVPEIDGALSDLVLRCLAREPGDRYPSAEDLLGALADIRGGAGLP